MNGDRTLHLREEDLTDENDEPFKDISSTLPSTLNEKIFVVVDMKPSSASLSSQTIGFLPNDNQELVIPSPSNQPFNSLTFSFRTRSNVSTLIQFEQISLNIDVDGYLALVIREKQAQRLLRPDQQKPINDGHLYTVHLQRTEQNLQAWISHNQSNQLDKISLELPSAKFTVEQFVFGARGQFLGCLQNVIYNEQVFSFKHLPDNRQRCPSSSLILKSTEIALMNNIYIDQMISFKEYDRPLIVSLVDQQQTEEFRSFSLIFYTQESNSVICSLADQTHEHFLTISIVNERLLVTYDDKTQKRVKFAFNNSLLTTNGREHRLSLKFLNKDEFLVEIDGSMLMKKLHPNFRISTIYIGQFDSFIKDRYPDLNGENFVGCVKDVLVNDQSIIKLDHIHHLGRLTNTCQLSKRGRKFKSIFTSFHFPIRSRHVRHLINLPVS